MREGDFVLGLDKPAGPTSHDLVARARRTLGTRRVGHCGTLDPFASGLLVLCVGRATRIAEYLVGLDKTYIATARLGAETDTHDLKGKVTTESDAWKSITEDQLERALDRLRGTKRQRPPRYSAKKVGGTPAHRRTRRGEQLELARAPVSVHQLALMEWTPPSATLRIHCSSGTYVRALARDLGRDLGVGAHLTELRRLSVGNMTVAHALPAEALMDPVRLRDARTDPLDALEHLPLVEVGNPEAAELSFGRSISVAGNLSSGAVRLSWNRRLLAIAECSASERGFSLLRPCKVFPS